MRILQHMDRMCDRMFSYNRYPYNCASVQRALLAPEILNESFLKCRYFTALYAIWIQVDSHVFVSRAELKGEI